MNKGETFKPEEVTVSGRSLGFNPGQMLILTAIQLAARVHNVRVVESDDEDRLHVVEVVKRIEFKQGEELVVLTPLTKSQLAAVEQENGAEDDSGGKTGGEVRPDDAEELMEAIIEAIGALDPENQDDFTSSGVPSVKAIEAVLGYDISAEERDDAWDELKGDAE